MVNDAQENRVKARPRLDGKGKNGALGPAAAHGGVAAPEPRRQTT